MPEKPKFDRFGELPWFNVPNILPNFETEPIHVGIYNATLMDEVAAEAALWRNSSAEFIAPCMVLADEIFNLKEGDSMILRDKIALRRNLNFLLPQYFKSEIEKEKGIISHKLKMYPQAGNLLIAQSRKFGIPVEEALERNIRLGIDVAQSKRTKGMSVYFAPLVGTILERHFFPTLRDQEQM